jgi:hypothetical protein
MQSTRLVGIPLDHAVAEMAAFPLASEAALRQAVTLLDPALKDGTGPLWRQAEQEVLGHFPGFSVDEVVALRDKMWFGSAERIVPLHAYLRRLAAEFLERQGNEAVPHLPVDPHRDDRDSALRQTRARRQWCWLAFALPADLLLAALGDERGGPDEVRLLTPALERLLQDRGYAETHLHVGAAVDFPLLWLAALHAIADREVKADSFVSPGAGLNGGRDLAPWLLRAALARYVLAAYLGWRRPGTTLADYLVQVVWPRLAQAPLPAAFPLLVRGLAELRQGRLGRPIAFFTQWQALYVQLTGVSPKRFPRDPARTNAADPVNALLPLPPAGQPRPEVRFLRAGLTFLEAAEAAGSSDPLFTALFWQIVRVRALLYRHAVQRPMTPGLQWFTRFYARLRPARNPISEAMQLNSAARLGGQGRGLRSLEIRTSPSSKQEEIKQLVEEVAALQLTWARTRYPAEGGNKRPELGRETARRLCGSQRPAEGGKEWPELGLVFHFTKDRAGGAREGRPQALLQGSHADPTSRTRSAANLSGYRFAGFFRQKQDEALALAWVLRRFPLSVQVVRGLDVCTDELGVPNWVFVPLLRHVRQAADAAVGVVRAQFGRSLQPLRTTVHAGEDFVHLLTGLRFVDEAVDQLGLREGDRIGHGIALGIDPRTWARRAGRLAQAVEERLFDLIWEWTWYGQGYVPQPDSSMRSLDYEIGQLTWDLFGWDIPPIQVARLRRWLANPAALRRIGFPNGLPPRTCGLPDNPVGHVSNVPLARHVGNVPHRSGR